MSGEHVVKFGLPAAVWYCPEINVLIVARMIRDGVQYIEWDWHDMHDTGIKYDAKKDLTEYFDWVYIGDF